MGRFLHCLTTLFFRYLQTILRIMVDSIAKTEASSTPNWSSTLLIVCPSNTAGAGCQGLRKRLRRP